MLSHIFKSIGNSLKNWTDYLHVFICSLKEIHSDSDSNITIGTIIIVIMV